MMKHATTLRRGAGKPYLVYGKMQPPAQIDGIESLHWEFGGFCNEAPAVFHSAWEAPEGDYAVVLANWTGAPREVTVSAPRLGEPRTVTVPPCNCLLLEKNTV